MTDGTLQSNNMAICFAAPKTIKNSTATQVKQNLVFFPDDTVSTRKTAFPRKKK